ncbi:NAD-dependent epimerase [Hydrogenophaga sp. BPS33]|uniref:NAD-dependent epimerase n=1 Tax=Hydrogenophaga sp. BPS33 TaxID=2651974 RepID=UPI00131FA701|nr:NAD-dependent epimerase [Hydrogenophaga sp. BPS33]QHE84918.1 NAD-dependent epimerase [Hydrogenophaga sp. BPS33]
MHILLTGAAGFIGAHTAQRLLARGDTVLGIDNLNGYYDVALKQARLKPLQSQPGFAFEQVDVADREAMAKLFARHRFDAVVHLAAQAGVRYSITNPMAYIDSNLAGFGHILEGCRAHKPRHLVYASSSSVYGGNTKMPFEETDAVDHPVSLYAATKKANELMAHTYSHLYNLPTTGLRFFTVYGPWGRPDMAYFSFTKAVLEGRPIQVFNHGKMKRDFTYIDDIVEGVLRVLDKPATPEVPGGAPYRIFNIGNNDPVPLMDFIGCIENALGQEAVKEFLPMQDGDVPATYASTDALHQWVGFAPSTPLKDGIERFVRWYRDYHRV